MGHRHTHEHVYAHTSIGFFMNVLRFHHLTREPAASGSRAPPRPPSLRSWHAWGPRTCSGGGSGKRRWSGGDVA
ncbi:hypothetical protein MSAN_00577500 [Mycena sanguinolenta]|uniref:Uncharacterized protein n=1 Tax=Mycena sanguinolenta TaxID=230812 RepID=A0A8H6ZB58_9AGAR|nr:hypothetical protein MSAN_00577500 [Mycena sanguinolenta]